MPLVDSFAPAANLELPPLEALAFFQAKGLKSTFAWQDMLGDEHDLAFTVAKMMEMDLLATVKKKLDRALIDGKTLADFKRELIPRLQNAGWWGRQDVVDPLTGQVTKAQLGSASRLETIFRTNLQSAYSVGRWQAIEAQADTAPICCTTLWMITAPGPSMRPSMGWCSRSTIRSGTRPWRRAITTLCLE